MVGSQIRELLRPLWVRVLLPVSLGVGTYDGVSSQFNLPKLSQLFGKTGALLPWWGWLLVIQAVAVAALFDFVRRNVPVIVTAVEQTPNQGYLYLDTKLENVRVDGEINKRDLAKLDARLKHVSDRTAQAFNALHVREQLAEAERLMAVDVELLHEKLRSGGVHDVASWNAWESVYHHWETNLKHWLGWGKFYFAGLERRVLEVSEEEYSRSRWDVEDHQFPTADANRRFKRHRLILSHWNEVRGTVINNIGSVAFHGMTEQDVRSSTAAETAWKQVST
jgi:hypothetical protein